MSLDPARPRWLYVVDQSRTPPHTIASYPVHGLRDAAVWREEHRICALHPEIDDATVFLRDSDNDT